MFVMSYHGMLYYVMLYNIYIYMYIYIYIYIYIHNYICVAHHVGALLAAAPRGGLLLGPGFGVSQDLGGRTCLTRRV